VVVLAVNHAEFEGFEAKINEHARSDAIVYDIWGALDRAALDREYDGFGIAQETHATDRTDRRASVDSAETVDDE